MALLYNYLISNRALSCGTGCRKFSRVGVIKETRLASRMVALVSVWLALKKSLEKTPCF